jgi:hypothetical protein
MSETAQPGHTQISTQLLRGFFLACGACFACGTMLWLFVTPVIWPIALILAVQLGLAPLGAHALMRIYGSPHVPFPYLIGVTGAYISLCIAHFPTVTLGTMRLAYLLGAPYDVYEAAAQSAGMVAVFVTGLVVYRISLNIGWTQAAIIVVACSSIGAAAGGVTIILLMWLAQTALLRGALAVFEVLGPLLL